MTQDEANEMAKKQRDDALKKNSPDGGEVYPNGSWGGITRRDWLAGLAMQGLLSNPERIGALRETVTASYRFADNMIKESNK